MSENYVKFLKAKDISQHLSLIPVAKPVVLKADIRKTTYVEVSESTKPSDYCPFY